MLLDPATLPFRHLIDAAPDGILIADQRSRIVLVNAECERMFGYGHDELVGKPLEVIVPERLRGEHPAHVAAFHAAPRLRTMGSGLELNGLRKDGSELPIEISLSPVPYRDQRLVVAGIRDVTDRRKIQREVVRANAYLVSAVDAIQDAFALFDETDHIVLVNSACRELFSGLSGPIIGRGFDEILRDALASGVFDFSDESREAVRQRWLAYHHEPIGQLDVRTGRGRYLRVVSRKTPEHGTVSLMIDVTDDVLREAELRTASAAKSEFLSSMSHELRTPLNAVLGFAQLLEHDRKQPLTDRQQDRLRHVTRGGEHLLRLIDDVLDLSGIEAGRVAISCEPVGVSDVLTEVAATLGPMAAHAQITLEVPTVQGELPRVLADRTRLAQILMNFGSNAVKYGRPGGHVRFEAAEQGDAVRITVIDDGIGIPADKRDRLFEPFQRAGQETGPIEGTGIGLAISKRLAGMMHGAVGYTSDAGRGSRFWVEVPVYRDHRAELPSVPRHLLAASPLAAAGPRHVIVYVEDNPSNIAFMRELVADLPSIELLIAPTAEIGLPMIRAHHPAVVIMDVNLPGMSGFEAVKQLAAWDDTRAIPVVGLSAAALIRDQARAQSAGFYRYLTKPVRVAELTAVLEDLLTRRQP